MIAHVPEEIQAYYKLEKIESYHRKDRTTFFVWVSNFDKIRKDTWKLEGTKWTLTTWEAL